MRNETKVINYNEMKTLFLGVDKTKETNLKYEVEVGMNKGKTQTGEKIPNPYLGTTKVVSGNFKLSDYTKRVIVNGGKEGIDIVTPKYKDIIFKKYVTYYEYERKKYPHVGIGKFINF